MHDTVEKFIKYALKRDEVEAKKVLEIGSRDINGSVGPIVTELGFGSYTGTDLVAGNGVDVVCPCEGLLEKFEPESFDLVISTETLEHVTDWRVCISNMKKLCRPGGIILITCRSRGFGEHSQPEDHWRFEWKDMEEIFSDCEIMILEKDPHIGVFIKVRKSDDFKGIDLSGIEVFSVDEAKKRGEAI